MSLILAIDPGPIHSAWVLYDTVTGKPDQWAKEPNEDVLETVDWPGGSARIAVEMIASYGMSVGAEVFETCVWCGRFIERYLIGLCHPERRPDPIRVYRRDVKLHLCGSARAKDTNIRQALIDRYGGKEEAIGRKASPGPLYGISGDVWAALAVAVTAAETNGER